MCRGSLFTHQELAIAYVLDFPHAIFLRQKGVELNGLAKYMLANAVEFSCAAEIVGLVQRLVTDGHWSPSYSRNLVIVRFDQARRPSERSGRRYHSQEHPWFVVIGNHRGDCLANHTVAHVVSVSDTSGKRVELPGGARGPLRWDPWALASFGHGIEIAYEVDLLPGGTSAFEAFCVVSGQRSEYERWDESRARIGCGLGCGWIQGPGAYQVRYQVLAERFPPLKFGVEIHLTGEAETTTAGLCE